MTFQDKTVLFCGKFQPPHIGHVITLSKIKRQYKNVIVGITEDEPRVMPPEKVEVTFSLIFPEFKYVIIPDRLTDYSKQDLAESNIPQFDLMLTGNQEVIDWANRLRIPVRFFPRAKGQMYSGSEIREAMLQARVVDGMEIRIRCCDKRVQSSFQVRGQTTLNDVSLLMLELKRMEHILLDESENYETILDIRSDEND